MRVRVLAIVVVGVVVRVVVLVVVLVTLFAKVPSVGMRVAVRWRGCAVRAGLGLERALRRRHLESHALEQRGEDVIGLENKSISADLERHVPVAQVIGRFRERERGTLRRGVRSRGDDEDLLLARPQRDQRAIFGDEDVAAADDAAAREEDADAAAGRIGRLETAFLARVPVERDDGGAANQRRRETMTGADELAGDEERHVAGGAAIQNRK